MDEQQFVDDEQFVDDAEYEEETKDGLSLAGKVLGGLLAVGTVAGGAAVYKNRDRIKAWTEEISAKRKAKKTDKLLKKLAKLGYKEEDSKAETKE